MDVVSRKEAVRVCVAAGLSEAAAGQNVTRMNRRGGEVGVVVPWLDPGALALWYESYYSRRGLPEWLKRMVAGGGGVAAVVVESRVRGADPAPAAITDPIEFFTSALEECQRSITRMKSQQGQDAQVVTLTRTYADLLAKLQDARERDALLNSRAEISVDRAAEILDRIHATIPRSLTRDLLSQRAAAQRALAEADPIHWANFCEEFFAAACQRLVDVRFADIAFRPAA